MAQRKERGPFDRHWNDYHMDPQHPDGEFQIDRYEYPNCKGALPTAYVSLEQAKLAAWSLKASAPQLNGVGRVWGPRAIAFRRTEASAKVSHRNNSSLGIRDDETEENESNLV